MPCKVYVHYDVQDQPALTVPVEIARPEEMQFGTIKQAFIARYSEQFPNQAELDYNVHCFWNQDNCPIADKATIAVYAWEHMDFFLRLLPEGAAAGAAGALSASREKMGELSYYYAHDRQKQSLISRPQSTAVSASSFAPTARREPVKATPGAARFNNKSSPFGTDISAYESITSYTWEDHDGDTVKVLVPLDGIGKLPPSQIRVNFSERQFELLIDGYNGKNLRFACYKTHGEMKADECKHVVRANRINLVIRKAKEKDIWFDLFKKKAIGETDDD